MQERALKRALGCGMIAALVVTVSAAQAQLWIDFGDHENAGDPVQEGWSAFTITDNDTSTTNSYDGIDVTLWDTGQPSLQDRLREGPANGNSITIPDVLRDFVFGDNNNPGEGLDVLIEGLTPSQTYQGRIWSYDDATPPLAPLTFIADWTANGVLVADDYNSGGFVPTTDDEKSFAFEIAADAEGKILLQALRTPESDGSSGVLNGLLLENGATEILRIDFGDHDNLGDPIQAGWEGFVITDNDTPTTNSYGGVDVTVSDTGQPALQDRLRSGPAGGTSITLSDVLRDFAIADNSIEGEGLNLLVEGLIPNQMYEGRIWSHDEGASQLAPLKFVADWTANGVLIADDYDSGAFIPTADNDKSFDFLVAADSEGKILFQALRTPESDGSAGVINGLFLDVHDSGNSLEGDLNNDGFVGSADLDLVRGSWGATVEPGESGDADGDGFVGSSDLDIVRANWGATAPANVPEPSCLGLALAGLTCASLRFRRSRR